MSKGFVKKGSLFVPTRNLWVPKRGLRDERGFISIPQIGAIAGSRRRTGAAASFSDDFTRADANPISNPSSSGGTWGAITSTGIKQIKILSNKARGSLNTEQNLERVSSPTFANDQKAISTIGSITNYGGVAVRIQGSTDPNCYFAYVNSGGGQVLIYRGNPAGSTTQIANITSTWSIGDILELRAVGTTITVYKNSSQLGSYTDSTYSSGQPGLYCYLNTTDLSSLFSASDA